MRSAIGAAVVLLRGSRLQQLFILKNCCAAVLVLYTRGGATAYDTATDGVVRTGMLQRGVWCAFVQVLLWYKYVCLLRVTVQPEVNPFRLLPRGIAC